MMLSLSGLPSYDPESLCAQCRSIDFYPMVKDIRKVVKNWRKLHRVMNYGRAISMLDAGKLEDVFLPKERCPVLRETLRELLDSASSRCPMCSTFAHAVTRNLKEMASESNENPDDITTTGGFMNDKIYVSIEANPLEPETLFFRLRSLPDKLSFFWPPFYNAEIFADRNDLPRESDLFSGRSIYPSFDMEKLGVLAASWVQNCLKNHDNCNVPPMSPPTRLIDVMSDRPKLVEPRGQHVQWTALSYCWGPPPWTTLQKNNIERWKKGVSLDEFPRTLRDAVLFTRALGCQYIWIDALCIIQGKKEDGGDFFSEAGRMKEYYRGALLTITAATSTNSGEGFTQPRPLPSDVVPIPWYHPLAESDQCVYIRPANVPYEVWNWKDEQSCHLNTRGWTFQESILPPRTIVTSAEGLLWMCASQQRAESGQDKSYAVLDPKSRVQQMATIHESKFKKFRSKLLSKINPLDYLSLDLVPFEWETLVIMFSTRNFTDISDTLSAIAAMARVFQEFTNDTYCAGLWKSHLVQGLQWRRRPPWVPSDEDRAISYDLNPAQDESAPSSVPKIDPEVYIGPSWSWISLTHSKLEFCYPDEDLFLAISNLVTFTDVKVSLATNDPFGKLNYAELIIEALFREIREPTSLLDSAMSSNGGTEFDQLLGRKFARPIEAFEYEQKHRPYAGQQYGALQLCKAHPQEYTSGYFMLLILESVMGTEQWKRIGLMQVRSKDRYMDTLLESEAFNELDNSPWRKRRIVIV